MRVLLIGLIAASCWGQFQVNPGGGGSGSGDATSIQGRAVASAAPSDLDCLVWNQMSTIWEPGSCAASGNATKLQSEPVASTTPTINQCLVYDGAQWEPGSCSTGSGNVTMATSGSDPVGACTPGTQLHFNTANQDWFGCGASGTWHKVLVSKAGISGAFTYAGASSGSATWGVNDVAGTPNRANFPTGTANNGQVLTSDGGNPQQTGWSYRDKTIRLQFWGGDGVNTVTTGAKAFAYVEHACTINNITLAAKESGDLVLDVWMDSYANFPPTNADSITASAKPTLSGAQKMQDSVLTGWTRIIPAGSYIYYEIESATTITQFHFLMECDL